MLHLYVVLEEPTGRPALPACSKSSTCHHYHSVAPRDVSRFSVSTTTRTNLCYRGISNKLNTPLLDAIPSSISFLRLIQSIISAHSLYERRKTGMNYLTAAPPVPSQKLFNTQNLLQTWKRITDQRENSFSSHS